MHRVAVATIAPNITLPIWSRMFQEHVLPAVDECRFIVGTPIEELQEMAMVVLDEFAAPIIRDSYQSHGEALTELYAGLPAGAEVLVLEDDCFVTCELAYICELFERLPSVGGVIGSRMAKMMAPRDNRFLDTYGTGLYPNMMFAQVDVLRAHTDMDFTSRNCGDVGHMVGEQLHDAGVHTSEAAHVPQCRLSAYCGTDKVDPETWDGPWLHIGEMSVPQRFRPQDSRAGHFEAMACFAAALETGEVWPGEVADSVAKHVEVNEGDAWPQWQAHYQACKRLCERVFEPGYTSGRGVGYVA